MWHGQTAATLCSVSSHKAKRSSCLVKVNFPVKQTTLQTTGAAVTSEPHRYLAESLDPLTLCYYCLQHWAHWHTAVASAGALKTGAKCKKETVEINHWHFWPITCVCGQQLAVWMEENWCEVKKNIVFHILQWLLKIMAVFNPTSHWLCYFSSKY